MAKGMDLICVMESFIDTCFVGEWKPVAEFKWHHLALTF